MISRATVLLPKGRQNSYCPNERHFVMAPGTNVPPTILGPAFPPDCILSRISQHVDISNKFQGRNQSSKVWLHFTSKSAAVPSSPGSGKGILPWKGRPEEGRVLNRRWFPLSPLKMPIVDRVLHGRRVPVRAFSPRWGRFVSPQVTRCPCVCEPRPQPCLPSAVERARLVHPATPAAHDWR